MLWKTYEEFKSSLLGQGFLEPLVFGAGSENAGILLLGEAPGGEEIKAGQPFVGRAGKNLDMFLRQIRLSRDAIYITNVVKFRPYHVGKTGRRSNRVPNREEIALCRPCLLKELEEIRPRLIVTLGNTALNAVARDTCSIGFAHGKVLQSAFSAELFALYHPASIIYNPRLKSTYLTDVELLKEHIEVGKFFPGGTLI